MELIENLHSNVNCQLSTHNLKTVQSQKVKCSISDLYTENSESELGLESNDSETEFDDPDPAVEVWKDTKQRKCESHVFKEPKYVDKMNC